MRRKKEVPAVIERLIVFMNLDLIVSRLDQLIYGSEEKNLLVSLISETIDPFIVARFSDSYYNIPSNLTDFLINRSEVRPVRIEGSEWGFVPAAELGGDIPPAEAMARGELTRALERIASERKVYAYGLPFGVWTFSALPLARVIEVNVRVGGNPDAAGLLTYINKVGSGLLERGSEFSIELIVTGNKDAVELGIVQLPPKLRSRIKLISLEPAAIDEGYERDEEEDLLKELGL